MLDPCNLHQFVFIVAHIVLSAAQVSDAAVEGARANVTLRLALTYDINPECDESVYKVVLCAGEFTNECLHFGPVARYLQVSCASQASPEPITFLVTSVENPIELDVTVQRAGEDSVQRLRRTEFRLTEGREITVTSFDLTLIVRLHADYFCLRNYFGELCKKFCNTTAVDHTCDEWGNPVCRSGYIPHSKTGSCRPDQCISQPNYCKNGGTCVTNPNPSSPNPLCLCPIDFIGTQCETPQLRSTFPTKLATLEHKTSEAATLSNIEQSDRLTQSTVAVRKNEKTSRSLNILNHPNLTSTQTAVEPYIVQSSGYIPAKAEVNSGVGAVASEIERQDSRAPEEVIHATFGETESGYKRFILPAIMIILMFSLLIACIAFLVWAIAQRRRKEDMKKSKKFSTPDKLPIINSSQRWASVDQSPTRFLSPFESSFFPTPNGMPSISETQYSFLRDQTVNETTFGVPPTAGFYTPTRLPTIEATNPFSISNDSSWIRDPNQFLTIPRPYSTFGRRSGTDASLLSSPHSPSDPCVQFNNLTDPLSMNSSWIPPRLQSSTMPGTFLMRDQQQQSVCIPSSGDTECPLNDPEYYHVSSKHSFPDYFQPTIRDVHGPLVPVCDPYAPIRRVSISEAQILESFVPTTTADNTPTGQLETGNPPPPKEFADVYPWSH